MKIIPIWTVFIFFLNLAESLQILPKSSNIGRNRIKIMPNNNNAPLEIRNEKIYASSLENYAFRRSKILNNVFNDKIFLTKRKNNIGRKLNKLLNTVVDELHEKKLLSRKLDIRSAILNVLRRFEEDEPKKLYDFSELVA